MSIGYHSDMRKFISENVISSATWYWGPMFSYMTKLLLNNETWWGNSTYKFWNEAQSEGIRVVHVPD